MYCPRCGQQQQIESIRFCSRCRFLMIGMNDVIENGGLPKEILDKKHPDAISPRRRGLKQGGLLFLSGIIVVPILGIFTAMMNGEGYAAGIAAILTFLGGIIRMIYALFESGTPTLENDGMVSTLKNDLLGIKKKQKALPPQQTEPIETNFQPPAGHWRETAELQPTEASEKQTQTFNKKTF